MFLEIVMLVIHYIQLTQLRYPSTKVFAEYWTVCTVIKLFGTPCTLWHLQNIGNNTEDNNYSMKSRYFKINREKKVQAMHVRTLFACFISFIYFILLIFCIAENLIFFKCGSIFSLNSSFSLPPQRNCHIQVSFNI